MEHFTVRTVQTTQFIPIGREVQAAVEQLGIRDGVVLVYVPHTTAGVLINEGYDPAVMSDLGDALRRAVPDSAGYRHAEGNSPAHVKSVLTGQQVMVPVENGRILLGRWQEIFFAEFDGPRSREVWIKPISVAT